MENTGGGYSKNESTGACRINPSTIFNSGSDANMDNIPYDAGKDKTEKKQNNNDENKEEGSE